MFSSENTILVEYTPYIFYEFALSYSLHSTLRAHTFAWKGCCQLQVKVCAQSTG